MSGIVEDHLVDRRAQEMTEPLIAIFSLLSRADSTPLTERRRASGHILGVKGEALVDPAQYPGANAFESDPNINFEKWGEYWRKVHGVRFIYQEDKADRSFDRLLRYDQIHRFAAGPTNFAPLPYLPPIDAEDKLFPTVIGHVPSYGRPRWDGVAHLVFKSPEDIPVVLGSDRVRTKILPEDKAIFRDIAPILARQFVIIPSETSRDAITLVKIHIRKPQLDRLDFQERWLHAHADLVLRDAEAARFVKRYVQVHNIGPIKEGEPFFHPEASLIDGVSLLAFTSMNDAEEFLQTDSYRAILDSERAIGVVEGGEYWTAVNFNVINQLQPERSSRR